MCQGRGERIDDRCERGRIALKIPRMHNDAGFAKLLGQAIFEFPDETRLSTARLP